MDKLEMTYQQLLSENQELNFQLEEANDTINAIRTGKVDALIVNDGESHQLYTLKTADQTYRVFIEKMNEGAVTINKAGIILYSNSRFAEMVAMPLEKVIGLIFEQFVPVGSLLKFKAIIEKSWKRDCKEEIELINQEQKLVPCLLSCNTLALDEGLALSLILTDLSILKETEKELKLRNEQLEEARSVTEKLNNELEDTVKARTKELFVSREHFQYLANNVPQITWTSLPDGRINYCNLQWFEYTGLTVDETLRDGWGKVIHPDDVAVTNRKYAAALQSGDTFEVENRYKRKTDGTYRWHFNRAKPLRNEDGEIVFWVGTAVDIEEHKRELEKKDEFIGIASHELRTPLTSVKGYLQLVNAYQKEELPPIVKQYITKGIASLNKLQNLVNDLLDVSKINAGRLEYAENELNLSELIKTATENAMHIYPEHKFTTQIEPNLTVMGNMERLEQVFMNLISNAVKYSQGNKNVIIKTELLNNNARVSVTDFGIGLSDDQKDKIFERFYRVEDKKYMTSGLGMGLYISSEIIRNHRGKISVDSKLNEGATFYFELPLI